MNTRKKKNCQTALPTSRLKRERAIPSLITEKKNLRETTTKEGKKPQTDPNYHFKEIIASAIFASQISAVREMWGETKVSARKTYQAG